MDTDDLSIPTYEGIISEAEIFHHDLTLQFGDLASICKDDDDYLDKVEALAKEWLNEDYFNVIIDDVFFGESVDYEEFKKTLEKILSNITEIRKTPIKQRKFEDWG